MASRRLDPSSMIADLFVEFRAVCCCASGRPKSIPPPAKNGEPLALRYHARPKAGSLPKDHYRLRAISLAAQVV